MQTGGLGYVGLQTYPVFEGEVGCKKHHWKAKLQRPDTSPRKKRSPTNAIAMLDDAQAIEHADDNKGHFLLIGEHCQHHTGIESNEHPEASASVAVFILRVQVKE